jgi:hypothetical protein
MDFLLKICKKKFESQYNKLINDSKNIVTELIGRIFINRRRAFVPTDKLAPDTITVLQSMSTADICDYLILALLHPIAAGMASNTITIITRKALKQFAFLIDIFQLEIFLGAVLSKNDSPQAFGAAYEDFVKLFLSVPLEGRKPTIWNFKKHLLSNLRKYGISKSDVTELVAEYFAFILSDDARKETHKFEKRLSSFILGFYELLEPMDIFEIQRRGLNNSRFDRPFVVLKGTILEEIEAELKVKTVEQS